MGAQPDEAAPGHRGWTIEKAEDLLQTLTGVVSTRVVARPGGEIEEIHVLTTEEISPKQTVRNVESALLAHFDLTVDHRKISVAQTRDHQPAPPPDPEVRGPRGERRILFLGHQVEHESSHRVKIRVSVEWDGERYAGEATGADLPRTRLETLANATLRAVEAAVDSAVETAEDEEPEEGVALALDGVKLVEAFDRHFLLVAVHAIRGRDVTALAGAAAVDDSADRAVILASLQATDRWVRGRMN